MTKSVELAKTSEASFMSGNNTTVDAWNSVYEDWIKVAPGVFTGAYAVIFLVGLCGNVFTCLVVLRRHYVHAQTPFYLNLAFSDLLLLIVGLPTDIHSFWLPDQPLGGTWFCVGRAVLTETATNASILTIVVFTAERWITICHPSTSKSNFPNSSAGGDQIGPGKNAKLVAAIWSMALIAALPLSAQLGLMPLLDPLTLEPMEGKGVCHVVPERALPYSFEASSIVFFVIPMILIIGFYSSIIVQLRRTVARQSSVNESPLMQVAGRVRQQAKASGAVVKILIAVVVAFFICFSPYHLQRLLANYMYAQGGPHWAYFAQLLFTISGLFYYISTAVNPVIYCLLSKRFRFALENLLFCRRRRRKSERQNFSNDLLQINRRLNRRALIVASTYQGTSPTAFGTSKTRLRYPVSCPLARKHGVHSPFLKVDRQRSINLNNSLSLVRPETLSVSSAYVQQNSRTPTKISCRSSSSHCNNRWSKKKKRKLDIFDQRKGNNVIEQCAHSDCYNVYYDGDKLVISFVSDFQTKPGNSI